MVRSSITDDNISIDVISPSPRRPLAKSPEVAIITKVQQPLAAAKLAPTATSLGQRVLPLTADLPSLVEQHRDHIDTTDHYTMLAALKAAALAVSALEEELSPTKNGEGGLNNDTQEVIGQRNKSQDTRIRAASFSASRRIAGAEAVLRYNMLLKHNDDLPEEGYSKCKKSGSRSVHSQADANHHNNRSQQHNMTSLEALEHRMDTIQWQLGAYHNQLGEVRQEIREYQHNLRLREVSHGKETAVLTQTPNRLQSSHVGYIQTPSSIYNGGMQINTIGTGQNGVRRLFASTDDEANVAHYGSIPKRPSQRGQSKDADEWRPQGFISEQPSTSDMSARWNSDAPKDTIQPSFGISPSKPQWPNAETMALLAAAEQRVLDGSSFLSP